MTLLVDVGDRPSYLGDTNLSRDGSLVVISQDLPNFFSPSGTVLSVWQLWHTFRHLFAYEHSGTRAMSSWISSIRDSIHAIKSCIVGTLRFLTSYCGPGLTKGRINRCVLCKLSIFLPKLAGGGGLHEHAEVSNLKLDLYLAIEGPPLSSLTNEAPGIDRARRILLHCLVIIHNTPLN